MEPLSFAGGILDPREFFPSSRSDGHLVSVGNALPSSDMSGHFGRQLTAVPLDRGAPL